MQIVNDRSVIAQWFSISFDEGQGAEGRVLLNRSSNIHDLHINWIKRDQSRVLCKDSLPFSSLCQTINPFTNSVSQQGNTSSRVLYPIAGLDCVHAREEINRKLTAADDESIKKKSVHKSSPLKYIEHAIKTIAPVKMQNIGKR